MSSGEAPPGAAIDDIVWQGLLDALEDSDASVVPIVGPGLLQVKGPGGTVPYYEDLARRLAAALRVDLNDLGAEPTVEEVVLRFRKATTDLEFSRPYDALRLLLKNDRSIEPPEELTRLAEIAPLRLFITTTFDDLLERALRAVRGEASVERRGYLLRASTANTEDDKRAVRPDIPAPLEEGKSFVHYLFGLPKQAGDFAISDEERIELVHSLDALLAKGGAMKNLGDHLRGAQLLFLGCAFPDWLLRFFLRAIRGAPFYERRNVPAFVADSRAAPGSSLVLFLEQNRMRVLPAAPGDFVRELAKKWRERRAAAKAVEEGGVPSVAAPRGHEPRVVLSCPDDQAAADGKVDRAASCLRGWGFDVRILSWPRAPLEAVKDAIEGAAAYVAFAPAAAQWGAAKERLLAEWAALDASPLAATPETTHIFALAPAAWKDITQQAKARWPRTAQKRREAEPEDVAASVAMSLVSLGRSRMPRPLGVYVAASAEDRDDKALGRILGELSRHRWMAVRSRRDLLAGMDDEAARKELVEESQVLVLLLTIDLLGDAAELDAILSANDGSRMVVPIVVRACGWESDPRLSALTVLNDQLSDPATPLDQWSSADAAWTEAASRLCREMLDHFLRPA